MAGTSSPFAAAWHAGAGLGDLLEDALLVRGVPLDRLDEVGDQVGAPGELDVDPAERLLRADVGRAQLVEADDHEDHQGHDTTTMTMIADDIG